MRPKTSTISVNALALLCDLILFFKTCSHLYIPMHNFLIRIMLQVNYEANGWVVHHKSDIWAKSSADQGDVVWALWPMGGAWLCTYIWDRYTYTMDKVRF